MDLFGGAQDMFELFRALNTFENINEETKSSIDVKRRKIELSCILKIELVQKY